MPVGRQDLIKRVATNTHKSVKESTVFVKATLEAIIEALEEGESVRLTGFGVFSVTDTAASARVNPQTREKINVPARKRVKFTPGKDLDDAVVGRRGGEVGRSSRGPEFYSRFGKPPAHRHERLPGQGVTRGSLGSGATKGSGSKG